MFLKSGETAAGMRVLAELAERGLRPDGRTLSILLKGLVELGKLEKAVEMLTGAGADAGPYAFNIVIDAFARLGEVSNAETLAWQLEELGHEPDASRKTASRRWNRSEFVTPVIAVRTARSEHKLQTFASLSAWAPDARAALSTEI